jgi:hypothetical protein
MSSRSWDPRVRGGPAHTLVGLAAKLTAEEHLTGLGVVASGTGLTGPRKPPDHQSVRALVELVQRQRRRRQRRVAQHLRDTTQAPAPDEQPRLEDRHTSSRGSAPRAEAAGAAKAIDQRRDQPQRSRRRLGPRSRPPERPVAWRRQRTLLRPSPDAEARREPIAWSTSPRSVGGAPASPRLGRGPDLARDAVGQPSWQRAAPRASGRSRAARALRAWRSRVRSVGQAAPGRGRHGRRRDAAGDEQARAAYDPARRRPEGIDPRGPAIRQRRAPAPCGGRGASSWPSRTPRGRRCGRARRAPAQRTRWRTPSPQASL